MEWNRLLRHCCISILFLVHFSILPKKSVEGLVLTTRVTQQRVPWSYTIIMASNNDRNLESSFSSSREQDPEFASRREDQRRSSSENDRYRNEIDDEDEYYTSTSAGTDVFDDEDDEDDDDDDDELRDAFSDLKNNLKDEEMDFFGNYLVPNPILDSIDPDGAAERFPELARDPRFWIDMCLFIAFLNFLSSVGPRDPFPDIPWY
jgi:hypothetical protein